MFDIQSINQKLEDLVTQRGVGLKPNMQLIKVDKTNKFAYFTNSKTGETTEQ